MYLIASIFLFWFAWFINKKWGKLWYVSLPSAIIAGLLLAASNVGQWLGNILLMAADMAAGLVNAIIGGGVSGAMVLGLVALIGTIVIIIDLLKDRTCNKAAIAACTVTPIAALYAGGLVGQTHGALRDAGGSVGATLVSTMIGGG